MVEIEGVEQLLLAARLSSHHPASPLERLVLSIASRYQLSRDFFNRIDPLPPFVLWKTGRSRLLRTVRLLPFANGLLLARPLVLVVAERARVTRPLAQSSSASPGDE